MEEEQKRRPRLPGWAKILIAVALTLLVTVGGTLLLLGRSGLTLMQGYLLAKFAFVETDADLNKAVDQALAGMVEGLGDRWSYYLDPESYQSTLENRANNYVGVGVTINYEREEGLLVLEVVEGGPAHKAGVVAGDVITHVDGTSVAGEARYQASDLIAGEEGSQVQLTLLGEDGTSRTVTCTRQTLKSESASSKLLDDGVGYVRLDNFYSGSADSLREQVERMMEQGATSLVLDVRSNPGGYITELIDILDYMLPQGPVFVERPRWGSETVYESDEACVDLPMVVLVDANSYSAAELFAAQLRESAQVPIVGEVTSGKGYAQLTFPLLNGGGLGLSVSAYCTGSGHSLIGEGITPDVELALDTTDGTDNQLQAALDLLKK
ncbi:S41 family peptidase [Pseudoflavonifractor capillosus]|uniref:S41 family peptidase n=1 Tax=Pseudoflavonifractor capillosus TaxID=106588 RepID=UPI001959D70F|nr:S41 family peptidase [Pseudoflavonifractor capillosus]MBM6896509.1 S41 family peptidase [Pseudoflavonifractor capillosus]